MIVLGIAVLFSVALILACVFTAAPSDWAQCQDCQIWHNTRNGRTSWEPPNDWDGVSNQRPCPDCFNAENQTSEKTI